MEQTQILQAALASLFVGIGAMKLFRSREAIAAWSGGGWAADFSVGSVRMIGLAEVIASVALGAALVLPNRVVALLGCLLLGVIMSGAVYTHMRRREHAPMAFAFVIGAAVFALGILHARAIL